MKIVSPKGLRSPEHRPCTQLIQVSATQHPAGTSRWVVVTIDSGAWRVWVHCPVKKRVLVAGPLWATYW